MAFNASLMPKKFSVGVIVLIIVLVLLVGVAPGYYFYQQYVNTQKMLQNPLEAAKEEIAMTVGLVGKLIMLPVGEEPTLATVSDTTKLANQAFFANAQNGDKVLIYTKAKKAYLYRPSSNKIIDVAPVNIGSQASQQPVNIATSITPSPSAKVIPTPIKSITPVPTHSAGSGQAGTFKPVNVAIYNGTKISGLAARTETTLKTKASNVTVVLKGNATNDHVSTLVIDISGKHKAEAQQIAGIVGGTVSLLPSGEVKPTSGDILVILGPQ